MWYPVIPWTNILYTYNLGQSKAQDKGFATAFTKVYPTFQFYHGITILHCRQSKTLPSCLQLRKIVLKSNQFQVLWNKFYFIFGKKVRLENLLWPCLCNTFPIVLTSTYWIFIYITENIILHYHNKQAFIIQIDLKKSMLEMI